MASSLLLVVVLTATSVVVIALAVSQVKRNAADGAPARVGTARKRRTWRTRISRTSTRPGSFTSEERPRVDQQPRRGVDEEPAFPGDAERMQPRDEMTVRDTDRDHASESADTVDFHEPTSLDLATERSAPMKGSRPSKQEELEEHGEAYAQLGERVTAILTTAEQAAAEIRAAGRVAKPTPVARTRPATARFAARRRMYTPTTSPVEPTRRPCERSRRLKSVRVSSLPTRRGKRRSSRPKVAAAAKSLRGSRTVPRSGSRRCWRRSGR
jgi:hypothetical protein